MTIGDQSFNDRAEHLQENVYGSAKGLVRLKILQRDLAAVIEHCERPLRVLDLGCGAGEMSAWALLHGHYVNACDSSSVMVEHMQQRFAHEIQQQRIEVVHANIQDLEFVEPYDVIFCHAVLEWVACKDPVFDKIAELLAPDGVFSVMFYNAWAREMAQLVYGNFDYIERGYAVKKRVKLNPHYPAFPCDVEQALHKRNLAVAQRSGIRVFYDLMREHDKNRQSDEDILRHEMRVSQQEPYWKLGRYVHFVARPDLDEKVALV